MKFVQYQIKVIHMKKLVIPILFFNVYSLHNQDLMSI